LTDKLFWGTLNYMENWTKLGQSKEFQLYLFSLKAVRGFGFERVGGFGIDRDDLTIKVDFGLFGLENLDKLEKESIESKLTILINLEISKKDFSHLHLGSLLNQWFNTLRAEHEPFYSRLVPIMQGLRMKEIVDQYRRLI
jgi:hypothetical protein